MATESLKNVDAAGNPTMSDKDFQRFSEFIYDECGVKLPPAKKTMLTSRLLKRLRAVDMNAFDQYFEYVTSAQGRQHELTAMINVVTTNKTDFFREPGHFDFLVETALPTLNRRGRGTLSRKLSVWSAGCSSGEEPYTLAVVLADYYSKKPGDFQVLATDISTHVLEKARQAIYPEEAIHSVPKHLKHKYFLRGKGRQTGFCRIVPALRNRVQIARLNLNEGRRFELNIRMDIIFCRNVIIYFDRETQKKLFVKFYEQLAPGGFMFIGHSETLHGINNQFMPVATSVYQKPEY